MKLEAWSNLRVGDEVTVCTIEEMGALIGIEAEDGGEPWVADSETVFSYFNSYMHCLPGKTTTIKAIMDSHVVLEGDGYLHYITRETLRDEVIKK